MNTFLNLFYDLMKWRQRYSEAPIMTSSFPRFVSLIQVFGGLIAGMMCVHVFVWVSVRSYIRTVSKGNYNAYTHGRDVVLTPNHALQICTGGWELHERP